MPACLQLLDDADGIAVPAPDVDRADQPVDVRVLGSLLLQGLEQADLLGMLAIALGHGDVAAVVEEDVADSPERTEHSLLSVPERAKAEPALEPGDADRGVVGRLDDRHHPLRPSVTPHQPMQSP